jgi:hypothetical protein
VALLKNLQYNSQGLNRLKDKALPKLLSQSGIYLGLDVNNLQKQFEAFINGKQETLPQICLNFTKKNNRNEKQKLKTLK